VFANALTLSKERKLMIGNLIYQLIYQLQTLSLNDELIILLLMCLLFCITLVIWKLYLAMTEQVHLWVARIPKPTSKNKISSGSSKISLKSNKPPTIKDYIPAMIGAAVTFLLMCHSSLWAGLSVPIGASIGLLGKRLYDWFLKSAAEERRQGEVLLLYELLSIYTSNDYPMYESLDASSQLVTYLEKPIHRLLTRWGQGTDRALDMFKDELHCPEGDILVNIIKKAVVVGPKNLSAFMEGESKVMETLREFRAEGSLSIRPILQALYMALPGLALLGVTLLPIGYHIAHMISSLRAG